MRLLLIFAICWCAFGQSPEQRAISYLEGEVQLWSRDNGCYSCHNNGDGARALYAALNAGYPVQSAALEDTTRWLREPSAWDANKGDPGFSDKALARVQWAAALAAAGGADGDSLTKAAEHLAGHQNEDGSWAGEAAGAVGSPVTWGRALATAMAVAALREAGAAQYASQIEAAEAWLAALEPANVPEAAALALAIRDGAASAKGRRFIRNAQASDGGWGPYPNAPSEAFDTALAVLSLENPELVEQGRQYLLQTQLSGGGWLQTTRPSGSQSYAQHISTTAWALLALLSSDPERD